MSNTNKTHVLIFFFIFSMPTFGQMRENPKIDIQVETPFTVTLPSSYSLSTTIHLSNYFSIEGGGSIWVFGNVGIDLAIRLGALFYPFSFFDSLPDNSGLYLGLFPLFDSSLFLNRDFNNGWISGAEIGFTLKMEDLLIIPFFRGMILWNLIPDPSFLPRIGLRIGWRYF